MAKNTLIHTRDLSGEFTYTEVNISSFSVGADLQMDSIQLHDGVAHQPIRVSERYLTFTIDWPLHRQAEQDAFVENIRNHHRRSLTNPSVMIFNYIPEGIVYRGIIDAVQKSVDKSTIVYKRTYRMRLFTNRPKISSVAAQLSDYEFPIPTRNTVSSDDSWYDFDVPRGLVRGQQAQTERMRRQAEQFLGRSSE